MSPVKNNEIINQNAAKNPVNNLRPNAAYIPRSNQSENQQNQMIINRNYIPQNQASFPLLNKNQQFKQQPNNYMNQINNQNEYRPNNQSMINQNQMLSEQNNLNSNEEANEEEEQMPEENINPEPLRDPEGNLLNVESGRITMVNEEEEENDQNKNIANENNENTKKNDVDISYNDFDDSGWVKNYGGVTRPGKNIKGEQKINQDSLVSLTNINNIKDFNIFGVLDGHGPQGNNVSSFASEFIPAQIINHPEIKALSDPEAIYEKLKENNCQIITNAYLACDEQLKNAEFDAYNSGSTCILIIHIGNHIICSNVGDSRGLVSFDEQIEGDDELNFLEAAPLSIDYKPEILEEQKRILMSGGVVEKMKNEFGQGVGPFRVWARGKEFPGLAMSRSIGDLNGKNIGIISDPGILEYDLSESTKFIVVCSDGVWEFLTNENVINLGKSFYLDNDASGFCHQIVDQSVLQWEKNDIITDDITVVVAFFNI
jgi:serine/threonine protein phosphatase PrpC